MLIQQRARAAFPLLVQGLFELGAAEAHAIEIGAIRRFVLRDTLAVPIEIY